MKLTGSILAIGFLSSLSFAGTSNSHLDVSPNGKLLACSNRDAGTVTIVQLPAFTKLREIEVGRHPEGVSFVGAGGKLAVAVYDDDSVRVLDATTGKLLTTTKVFDEPYGIVSNREGTRIYVTLDYPGRVAEIDANSGEILREIQAGSFIRGIAISPDGGQLYVTEYYSAVVRRVDIKAWAIADEWVGAKTDNLARNIALHPTRPKAYLPHIRSKVTAVHGEGSIFPYVAVVDTVKSDERRRKRIPMDGFLGNLVTANPWEVAVSPDGGRFAAVFSGTNDMFVCNILDDNYRELEYSRRVGLGNNPRAVRFSVDGATLFVHNALDFNVVAYDSSSLRQKGSVQLCEDPLGAAVREGKILFYSALQPMVGRRWISCSSCHPDGQPDGRTWHNPEGLRNTQSLGGMAWTHPIHWSADRDEVQDFEHTIRGPLMQGRGLITGKVFGSLKEPNKGLSRQLDALAAYSNTHRLTLSPYSSGGLSESARRGRDLFFSRKVGCATCHSGPFMTDSVPREANRILRHDVGTGDAENEKMGPAYDTPTLLGVYRTAPYLHDGRAATLLDVLTTHNRGDKHGGTSHLTESELNALVDFLKALPYTDPEIEARDAGLLKVQ